MTKSDKQKQKLLAVRRILLEKSDDAHLLSADAIINLLAIEGIEAERKSIYSDIRALQDSGMDIIQQRGPKGGYCVGNRDFELPEVKVLVDAVSFCRFITTQKTEKLIGKLHMLCSEPQTKELHSRAMMLSGKSENESILLNIDYLNRAISERKVVSFKYYKWEFEPEARQSFVQRVQNGGREYQVQPCGLIWDNEYYYLVAYSPENRELRHYRLDRMKELQLLSKHFLLREFDLADYANSHFNMMGGRSCRVHLRVNKELTSVLVDKYGDEGIMPMPCEDSNYFDCKVDAVISDAFFGWLAGFNNKIRPIGPPELCSRYRAMLRSLLESCDKEG